jgi:hypothetical protein
VALREFLQQRCKEWQRVSAHRVIEDPLDDLWRLEPDSRDVCRAGDHLAECGSIERTNPDGIRTRERRQGGSAKPIVEGDAPDGRNDCKPISIDVGEALHDAVEVGRLAIDEILGLVEEQDNSTSAFGQESINRERESPDVVDEPLGRRGI